MKQIRLSLLLGLVFSVTTVNAQVAIQKLDSPDRIKGRYIVTIAAEHHASSVTHHIAARTKGKVIAEYDKAIKGFAIELSDSALKELQHDPRVVAIEADQTVYLNVSQTPAPWGLDRIDQRNTPLNNTYTYTEDGSGVHLYVIDSGLRASHTQFTGRVGNGANFVPGQANTNDCNGHGTHVAGTAAGTTYGVAKAAIVHPVRVFGCTGGSSTSTIVSGINWVINHHQAPAVINMSLGGGVSAVMDAATNNAINSGIFVAVAAGNSSTNACNTSPARVPAALTVGATTISDGRAGFSNFGTCLDIFAPGNNILSAWIGNNNATSTISGTSMASPHMAGIAALILDDNPSATPAAVTAEIIARSTPNTLTGVGAGSPNRMAYSLSATGGGAPVISNLRAEFIGCSGYQANYILDWSAPGATNYDVDGSVNGGNWFGLYNGSQVFRVFSFSQNTSYRVRVRGQNASGFGPFKQRSFRTKRCGFGGGGGGIDF